MAQRHQPARRVLGRHPHQYSHGCTAGTGRVHSTPNNPAPRRVEKAQAVAVCTNLAGQVDGSFLAFPLAGNPRPGVFGVGGVGGYAT
jgi:hypothetical protein